MSGRIAAYQEGYTDGFNDACEKYKKWGKWNRAKFFEVMAWQSLPKPYKKGDIV